MPAVVKVWIDLANSPNVLFFAPIVDRLTASGAEVVISARRYAQTVELAELHGLDATVIGAHGGSTWTGKAAALRTRVSGLRTFAREHRPDLAVSHTSHPMGVAARTLGIPSIDFMDFEHTPQNHLSFRTYTTIALPSLISLSAVRKYGATPAKTVFYNGFKEQVYLETFTPGPAAIADVLTADEQQGHVIALARPPADFATYHRFENPLFERWLTAAVQTEDAIVIVLPRTDEQRNELEARALPRVRIPSRPVDGANLIHAADLVVSAGGTMNREAAVMGVPAYSLFLGEQAAVDIELNRLSRLTFVQSTDDLAAIRLEKSGRKPPLSNSDLLDEVIGIILSV